MLFAGFFVSSDNIPVFLKEFEYLSIFKYGYESLMHNQFDTYAEQTAPNCTYECWCEPEDSIDYCDPFSQISESSQRSTSMAALGAIYGGCYLIAWGILSCLSNKYE